MNKTPGNPHEIQTMTTLRMIIFKQTSKFHIFNKIIKNLKNSFLSEVNQKYVSSKVFIHNGLLPIKF